MKLNHIKLDETPSTQDFLKTRISSDQIDLSLDGEIVSTRKQDSGFGRHGRTWTQLSQTLCFSFTLPKRENLTITSAEVSLHTLKFLKQEYQFDGFLKWPNDLLDKNGLKVAGILIDIVKDKLVVGIGINFGNTNDKGELEAAGIKTINHLSDEDFHSIPKAIYQYIFECYPQITDSVIAQWNEECFHIDKQVEIFDESQTLRGKFKGLGEYGEALLLCHESELKTIFSGTLRLAEST
jgi:BirA family biotin operon repressor/biotin-[acetyl-CoA-carboxylase] ligase